MGPVISARPSTPLPAAHPAPGAPRPPRPPPPGTSALPGMSSFFAGSPELFFFLPGWILSCNSSSPSKIDGVYTEPSRGLSYTLSF